MLWPTVDKAAVVCTHVQGHNRFRFRLPENLSYPRQGPRWTWPRRSAHVCDVIPWMGSCKRASTCILSEYNTRTSLQAMRTACILCERMHLMSRARCSNLIVGCMRQLASHMLLRRLGKVLTEPQRKQWRAPLSRSARRASAGCRHAASPSGRAGARATWPARVRSSRCPLPPPP